MLQLRNNNWIKEATIGYNTYDIQGIKKDKISNLLTNRLAPMITNSKSMTNKAF